MANFFICNELSENLYKECLKRRCDTIIYYKKTGEFLIKKNIALVNVNDERAAFEHHYLSIKSKIEKAAQLIPEFFLYDNIPLSEAFAKDLLWSTWIKGAFDYAINKYVNKGDEIYNASSKQYLNSGKSLLKTFKAFFKGLAKKQAYQKLDVADKKYGFYITSSFHLHYYKNLVKILGSKNCVYINNHTPYVEKGLENKAEEMCISKKPILPILKFSAKEMFWGLKIFGAEDFSILLILKQKFAEYIHINRFNFNSSIKVFFLIAQESSGFGNITALMGKKYNKLIINSHNGIKAGDVYNRDNHFGIWCVWDEKIKKILHEKCFINEDQLKIVGHLMQDYAINYIPTGLFDEFVKLNSGKKIISLFSIPRDLNFKNDVVQHLLNFVTTNDYSCLIIRLHPSENPTEWEKIAQFAPAKVKVVFPSKHSSKEELYDQLYISSLSIVFASTVAMESTWFGVPAITYEPTEKSILYNVDNQSIFHVRNLSELSITMENLLKNPPAIEVEKTMAAQKIANLVFEWEKNS